VIDVLALVPGIPGDLAQALEQPGRRGVQELDGHRDSSVHGLLARGARTRIFRSCLGEIEEEEEELVRGRARRLHLRAEGESGGGIVVDSRLYRWMEVCCRYRIGQAGSSTGAHWTCISAYSLYESCLERISRGDRGEEEVSLQWKVEWKAEMDFDGGWKLWTSTFTVVHP
jgi:hypothetical protein